ncbi:MAG: TetR/AcrR family transcriptional regulator [Anaerolineae bacterium]|jgi:AcrR family transcriptional regulator|nr:TetR/AcrR family transcriptional regulator [Anaerolineae bacterium]HQY23569.1 TetR/AcrR family transcriptional regulator [Thermoflexales bacterium]HRA53446.1 TetR/AcrR family transcriptional regulator [Thermoflexales bacterium]
MDGFARRKEKSKENIRTAAAELFAQFGVDKVSIASIARKAGVSQATIYNNFGSKDALARAFVAAAVDDLVLRVQAVLTPEKPYNDKIAAFVQFLSATTSSARPAGAADPVFDGSRDLMDDPEIKKVRSAAQERMTALMLGLIREGRQQGQVNPRLSEEALSVYFGVFMEVFISPELRLKSAQRPDLARELGALMLYGLSGPQPPKR